MQKMAKQHSTHVCMVCSGPIVNHELITGIPQRVDKSGHIHQLYGHYLHIRAELSPERLLRAVELKFMPLLSEDAFDGLVLKSTREKLQSGAKVSPIEKIYEFIRS